MTWFKLEFSSPFGQRKMCFHTQTSFLFVSMQGFLERTCAAPKRGTSLWIFFALDDKITFLCQSRFCERICLDIKVEITVPVPMFEALFWIRIFSVHSPFNWCGAHSKHWAIENWNMVQSSTSDECVCTWCMLKSQHTFYVSRVSMSMEDCVPGGNAFSLCKGW